MLALPDLPHSWTFYLLSVGAMPTFGVLFAAYAASLQVAELSVVTVGWIVVLQIGLVVLDRVRYGVLLPPGKWLAIALMLALQAYLILAPNVTRPAGG